MAFLLLARGIHARYVSPPIWRSFAGWGNMAEVQAALSKSDEVRNADNLDQRAEAAGSARGGTLPWLSSRPWQAPLIGRVQGALC
jgi:hypothetical protein